MIIKEILKIPDDVKIKIARFFMKNGNIKTFEKSNRHPDIMQIDIKQISQAKHPIEIKITRGIIDVPEYNQSFSVIEHSI